MNAETFPGHAFDWRARCAPTDPSADLMVNVVSLLKGRFGLERAQRIALAGMRLLGSPGGKSGESSIELKGLTANERLSIKIWLLDFVGRQARTLPDIRQGEAYEQAARARIAARLGS